MQISLRLPLQLLLGALTALAFSTAVAQAYTISPGGAITATSNGRLTIRSTLLTSQCDWQLIGSIDNTTPAAGDSIGTITSTNVTNCLGGIRITDLIATAGAYRIRLVSALGSPVTGALVTISNWTHRYWTPNCLFTAAIGFLIQQPASGVNQMNLLANSLSSPCGSASFSGSFSISPGQTIA